MSGKNNLGKTWAFIPGTFFVRVLLIGLWSHDLMAKPRPRGSCPIQLHRGAWAAKVGKGRHIHNIYGMLPTSGNCAGL